RNMYWTIKGTDGCRVLKELDKRNTDIEIIKKRYSAFFGTNLDSILTKSKAQTLLLAGVNTHACVRMTAIDAFQRDYNVLIALDCIDSYNKEYHEVSLKYLLDGIAEGYKNSELISLWGESADSIWVK
ncbi:unnamed protein product, partial [marine sediment metagenome]